VDWPLKRESASREKEEAIAKEKKKRNRPVGPRRAASDELDQAKKKGRGRPQRRGKLCAGEGKWEELKLGFQAGVTWGWGEEARKPLGRGKGAGVFSE